ISFTRVLIKIDAAVGLKKEVSMDIPYKEGDGYIKEVVRVEYEWKPPHCVDCQSFGHDTLSCPKRVVKEVPKSSVKVAKATAMDEDDDGFTEVKSRKKNKGANFGGIKLNKPKSMVMWQKKKGVDAKSKTTSLSGSSNSGGKDKGVSNPCLNTSNAFDVLNVDGDDMGDSRIQPKVSEQVSSDLNENRKEMSQPSSSNSGFGNGSKDKDEEDGVLAYASSFGGGNQLEEEGFDFYDGYEDQVVDLHGALKEFRDFKLSGSASTPIETEKPILKDPDGEDVDVHIYIKELASPKQTALGKDISNPFMDGSLPKSIWHFITVVSYKLMLFGLTKDVAVNLMLKVNDVVQLRALIDGKKVVVSEDVIRRDLYLDDADGVECFLDEEIFTELTRMGYEKPPPKLTFYKACSMASVVICLATVPTTSAPPSPTNSPLSPPQDLTPKPHVTPPQDQPSTPLAVPPQAQPSTTFRSSMSLLTSLMETCASLSQKVVELKQYKHTQALEILKLKKRVKKLEKK
nr:hypothetical protein [Tanacetum cinerariifolium]